ncbi:hypothetical protein [Adhaeribacter rhizoryzae]|uniref:Uncharacterized protein n=1 Tax=Adhaeribacter rhizoryzae TaxID=2607907 RepID=A0A5M6CZN1_9BACT|nr:hypothetical protein [Adhaeribacter rhizoryzae]KAA5540316.1 hypothetical protein F0145_22675 [Adhaeribacter rhizoryzae]
MRIRLILLLVLVPFISFGQREIPFEQIAFDYYKDTILKQYPLKKKITLRQDLEREHFFLWSTHCLTDLGFRLNSTDTLALNTSNRTKIDLGQDKRFRIKERNEENYPIVYSTISFSKKKDQNIVTIVEMHEYSGTTYHIIMNDAGTVKNWCKGGYVN